MCSRRHGGGRVRSTTPAEDRYNVLSAKRSKSTTAQQVANQFLAVSGKQISRKTIARRLRGGGLYARRPVVCVPLTRPHRTARFQWCREHHNWTEHDWACVLFSDEGCFGRQVAGRNYLPTNKNTLIRALTEEWDKLPQQLLDNIVQKKPLRMSAAVSFQSLKVLTFLSLLMLSSQIHPQPLIVDLFQLFVMDIGRDKSGERPVMKETENDVGSLEQLLLYADEHYLAGKLPLADHLGKVLHGVEEYPST
ncbi:transposable element Tcb2 transposase [Trichonephila clavipes]|nr:transposable element Tcb2 transposase [Trichonephila clavipes]